MVVSKRCTNIPKIMLKMLNSKSDCLNFCHMNVASIRNKIDELRHTVEGSNIHILSFSETWLKGYVSDKSVEIPGFKLLRSDRRVIRSGGVAMYVHKSLKFKLIESSAYKYDLPKNEIFQMDYLLAEIILGNKKLLYGVFYKAINTHELSILENVISKYCHSYDDIVLSGDFNEDLMRNNSRATEFRNIFEVNDLHIVNTLPTFFYDLKRSSSLLDLFIVRNLSSVFRVDQLDTTMSGHDILTLSYASPISLNKTLKFFRPISKIDHSALLRDAGELDWECILRFTDSDVMVETLNHYLLYLLEKHAPLTPLIDFSNVNAPWFNDAVERAIIERNIAWKCYQKVKSLEARKHYNVLRNRVNLLIAKQKRSYYLKELSNCRDTKQIWKKLRSMGIGKSESNSNPPFTPDEFNDFLTKVQTTNTFSGINYRVSVGSDLPRPNIPHFSFHNVNHCDTYEALMRVSSNACGVDQIPINFIKLTLPITLHYITHIYNSILTTSKFPSNFKIALIHAVHKKNSTFDLKDHRGIHILPAISKPLEKIMKIQMTEFLIVNNLLYKYQSGYRSGFSTETALIKVIQDIREDFDKRSKGKRYLNFLLLLDFSSAFDTVNHALLLRKLKDKFFFEDTSIKLIQSYLMQRCQKVVIDGHFSSFRTIDCGVPQGSVLGPILFSLYINDLHTVLKHCVCHLFADDVQLYLKQGTDNVRYAIELINYDLNRIQEWALNNCLILNANKSLAMIITRSKVVIDSIIKINGEHIPIVTRAKVLGLWINKKLNWIDQVHSVKNKVYGCLRNLWSVSSYLPTNKRIMLVKTLLLPHFLHCNSVMADIDKKSSGILQTTFNSCTRFAFQLKRKESVTSHSLSILGCSFDNYRKFRMCLMMRKILVTKTPEYLFDFIKFSRSQRTFSLIVPFSNTEMLHESFFVAAVLNWNFLPLCVKKQRSSLTKFSKECLLHFSNVS